MKTRRGWPSLAGVVLALLVACGGQPEEKGGAAAPSAEARLSRARALAARGEAPVLITGESGTGKTDVAWLIYKLSDRRERVFKAISCAQFEHSDPAFALGKIFGIGRGHGSAGWQAAFAVIIPVFFSCCLFVGLNTLALLGG